MSTGWRVRFNRTGSDVKPRPSEVSPREAGNRRNIPDRTWGLCKCCPSVSGGRVSYRYLNAACGPERLI